jgi:succinoglycan biosynthesis protein ExoM
MNYSAPNNKLRLVPKLDKVIIGVCTYRRPRMLARCLKSLAEQKLLDQYLVEVLVVDNDETPSARPVVDEADKIFPVALHYRHYPRRGIPQARNLVLEFARSHGADWLVFIDDDEEANHHCVANLLHPKFKHVPIVYGDTVSLSPSVSLPWKVDKIRTSSDPSMSNIRFCSRVLQSSLEFDEELALSGGEDEAFLAEARRRQFRWVKAGDAVTYAEVHPERFGYWRQMKQAFTRGCLDQRDANRSRSPFAAIGLGMGTGLFQIFRGFCGFAGSPTLGIHGLSSIRAGAVKFGGEVAYGAGRIAGLFGQMPEPFRTTDGR